MPKKHATNVPLIEKITPEDGVQSVFENACQLIEGNGPYFDRWLDSMRFAYKEGRISLKCLQACEAKAKGGDD